MTIGTRTNWHKGRWAVRGGVGWGGKGQLEKDKLAHGHVGRGGGGG